MPSHKRFGIGASACLTLAALTVPVSTTTADAHVGHAWASTHTLAIPVAGRLLGRTDPRRRLRISVALPMRNAGRINAQIAALSNPASPSYSHFLSPAQVLATYGPSAATARAVTAYLRNEGFTDVSVTKNRMLVDATGSVGQAEHAFGTTLKTFVVDGRASYANVTPAMVPASLSGKVSAVLGLSNFSMRTMHTSRTPKSLPTPAITAAGTPVLTGFNARQLEHVYEADRLPQAKKAEIAVVAGGDLTGVIKLLRFAENKLHYRKVPIKAIYTGPKAALTTDNPLSGNAEWDLDTQLSTEMAVDVKRLDIYDIATFTDPDVARAINKFVSDDLAETGSASLGECDALAYLDGAMITTDGMLAQGAVQGQSFFASTGDNGSACPIGASTGVPGGGPGDSWPSVGEYTTAVGGTTLLADSKGSVTSELAWVGGGGGLSTYETAGPWTLQANNEGQSSFYTNMGGRGVPDISAVADGNTGVLIYTGNKTPDEIGGTSVSAPLVMGLWARINAASGFKLGLASYRFYHLYNYINPATVLPGLVPTYVAPAMPKNVVGFRDVYAGTDGAYQAVPGYDFTTGVGTVEAKPLLMMLKKH